MWSLSLSIVKVFALLLERSPDVFVKQVEQVDTGDGDQESDQHAEHEGAPEFFGVVYCVHRSMGYGVWRHPVKNRDDERICLAGRGRPFDAVVMPVALFDQRIDGQYP